MEREPKVNPEEFNNKEEEKDIAQVLEEENFSNLAEKYKGEGRGGLERRNRSEIEEDLERIIDAVKTGREINRGSYYIVAPENEESTERIKGVLEKMNLGCETLPSNERLLEVYEKGDESLKHCYTYERKRADLIEKYPRREELKDNEGVWHIDIKSDDPRFVEVEAAFKEIHGSQKDIGVFTSSASPEGLSIKEAREKADEIIDRIESPGYIQRFNKRYEKYKQAKEQALEEHSITEDSFGNPIHEYESSDILLEKSEDFKSAKKDLREILPEGTHY